MQKRGSGPQQAGRARGEGEEGAVGGHAQAAAGVVEAVAQAVLLGHDEPWSALVGRVPGHVLHQRVRREVLQENPVVQPAQEHTHSLA